MPKRVDPQQRRRALAEAVFAVIGERGFEAVSLRDVAAQAGISMGGVQHWFRTKDEMLLFAMGHLGERVGTRMAQDLARLTRPSRRDLVRCGLAVMLPVDERGREEARVNLAFVTAATTRPDWADRLRDGYARLLTVSRDQLEQAPDAGELRPGLDPAQEATALYLLSQGLVGPLLIDLFTPEQAFAVLDHQLDRLFGAPGGQGRRAGSRER